MEGGRNGRVSAKRVKLNTVWNERGVPKEREDELW